MREFNADKLLERKEHNCGYRHCPYCSAELIEQTIDHHVRLICRSNECDFVYYHNPVPAAGALVQKNKQLLLVRRAHPPRIGYWCLPAGFMEWYEHPGDTAVREVAEETGLQIKLLSLFDVYAGSDDPRTNAVLILYLAKEIGGNLEASDDASEVGYFYLDDLPKEIAFAAHRQAISDYINKVHNS